MKTENGKTEKSEKNEIRIVFELNLESNFLNIENRDHKNKGVKRGDGVTRQ